jgi:GNAT superfamily N-acetyltransferase
MDLEEPVKIRILTLRDLDAVSEIDYSFLGIRRTEYWEQKLEKAETSVIPSLAAEIDGNLVGFILGRVSGWEYGIPNNVGWIDVIGVTRIHQKKGIAQLLFKEMVSMFRKIGVDTIYVFINWREWDLLKFFDKMKFRKGDMINLELKF